jgi:hypothetical protein
MDLGAGEWLLLRWAAPFSGHRAVTSPISPCGFRPKFSEAKMLQKPSPARTLWMVPGGGVGPPRRDGRRILSGQRG